jgi:Leucine-rich repeat (LRR) protein
LISDDSSPDELRRLKPTPLPKINSPRFSALTRDNSPAANLNLWKKRLGVVPESVWEQTELETLVLADNDLKEISLRIGALKKLRMLDLGHNLLSAVPETLGELSGLTDFLYLHDNRLTALPASLGKLTRLRYLNIGENPLEEFPECVCEMAGLIEMRATDNGLREVPGSIGRLSLLRELHLRNNKLSSLPGEIGLLGELRLLDLRGNPLTQLPCEIVELPKLEKFDLRWVTGLEEPEWFEELEARGCVVYR